MLRIFRLGLALLLFALAAHAAPHKVVVYYFYFTPRCETCLNIEAYAKQAVDSAFAPELKSGVVEWHAYDTGDSLYAHFWDDFKLEVKSLVMVELQDGQPVRYKICDKVWDLVATKPEFLQYVQAELRAYLQPAP